MLRFALEGALALGHSEVGTAHILGGLAREPDGIAFRILSAFGVEPEELAAEALASQQPGSSTDLRVLLGDRIQIRRAKEAAIQRDELDNARALRERERALVERIRPAIEQRHELLLDDLRRRLETA